VGKIDVRDALGVRWSVRARRLRRGEASRPMVGPEEESLRRQLATLLAPHPVPVHDPLRGVPGGWRTPGDTSDVALRETRADFGDPPAIVSGWWALGQLPRLIGDAVGHLRTPWSDTWRLEATARGRIRRWARWEVEGAEATVQAAAMVAAALRAGRVPQPCGAVLVDVVDQRPAVVQRRGAGLGGARRAD
jgi:hypothetical protein